MRVGWIWGLYETQLPFPVHCTKERYHIYTDGKEFKNVQLLWTTKCAQEKKKNFKRRIYGFFFSWTGICSLSFVFFNGLQLYEAQFIWSVLSAVVTRDHIILEVLETILGQLQCSLWSGLSRGLSRHKIKTSWQYTDSSHSYTCTTG